MFREIRTSEKITDKDEKNKRYLNIKPEGKELSVEELNDEVKSVFYELWGWNN